MSIFDIDVAALAAGGIDVRMKDPLSGKEAEDENGDPYVITVLGVDCPQWQNGVKAVQAEKGLDKAGFTEMMDHLPEVMAKNTLKWGDNIALEGELLSFSAENALRLYKTRPWVAQQLYMAAINKAELRKKLSSP